MMNFYRVEHPEDGRGPYRRPDLDVDLDSQATERHPLHGNLDQAFRWRGIRFAFSDVASLCVWFNSRERRLCREAGYVMAVYAVEPEAWLEGNRQVVFDDERAVRVEVRELPENVEGDMQLRLFAP